MGLDPRICQQCGNPFVVPADYPSESQRNQKFCNRRCYMEWKRAHPTRKAYLCIDCKAPIEHTASRCKTCYGKAHSGPNHHNWKCGIQDGNTYRVLWTGPKQRKKEHLAIAEKALGRPLETGEVVHHFNGNKKDNRNSNLLICTKKYHQELHARMSLLYQQEHF